MTAKSAGDLMSTVVNNTGVIEAKTLHANDKGEILLDGGESGQVEVSGTLDASGKEAGQSAGSIKVIGQKTVVNDGTNLLARGAIDGGKIETSGDVLNLGNNLNIDAKGERGKAGEWLLDPLNVYIADNDPTTAYDAAKIDIKKYESDNSLSSNTSINYHDPTSKETADASAVSSAITWIKTKTITDLLNKGTDVTIQAIATNGVANITVNSPIKKEAGTDATFTLDAMRNITINKAITSTSGKLNVLLNSDTDGNKIGAVIINADIDTNGGNFISSSGGNLVYSPNKENETTKGYDKGSIKTGTGPKSDGSTVGTYFGNVNVNFVADGSKADRYIKTKGGDITLNGEVAIGLNGGTLTVDSSGKDTNGAVKVTGIINSGNSYATYIYGTDEWENLINNSGLVDKYLEAGTVPSYHYKSVNYVKNPDGSYKVDENGNYETTTDSQTIDGPHYTYAEANTEDPRWTGKGIGYSTTKGDGWTAVKVTETSVADSMTVKEFLVYYKTAASANYTSKYGSFDPSSYTDNTSLVTALKNDKTTMGNGKTMYENLKADINDLLSVNWFVAKNLAKGENGNGSAVGDTYLATLTTVLENSLTAPNSATALFVGARGSGVLHKTGGNLDREKHLPYSYYGLPDDLLYSNGMYWVTGPEGLENNGKGTQFYSNVGSDWSTVTAQKTYNSGSNIYGFVNWQTWPVSGVTRTQPDNSGPFLTVGYGTQNQWDDIAMAGGYGGDQSAWAKGFVQEKNLANSSLKINSGTGEVKLQGDIGKSKALDTVSIESNNAVTVGTDNNNVTDYYHGTIYVDHGLYISGNGVKVGGEIHSGESEETDTFTTLEDKYKDNVTILSSGNIEVHGITANPYTARGATTANGGKISLTSTGDSGKITLGAGVDYDGNATAGTIASGSSDNGAVIIDAQGSNGALVNKTTGTNAITTGEKGTWQVYVNSPSDHDTSLGSNLNSGTNAQWTAKSGANSVVTANGAGNALTDYTDTSSNKFIFQVTPVITISGGYASKTYGDTLSEEMMTDTLTSKATYKDSSGNDIDVTSFKNFDESSYLTYVTSSDGTKTGLATVSASSDGAVPTATRTSGNEMVTDADGNKTYKTASDGNKAFYVMDVAYQDGVKTMNGYDKAANDGEVEITRKTLIINTDGTQTYGNSRVKSGTPSYDKTQLVNGDTLTDSDIKYTISTDGTYADSKGSNDTAHVGKYEDQYLTSSAEVKASDGSDASANYKVTGSGTITVNPADLYLTVGDVSTTYGTAFDDTKYGYTVDSTKGGLVNGDTQDAVLGDDFLSYTNAGNATDPDKIAKGAVTQNTGTYALQGTANSTLADYNVHITSGTATVNKAKLALTVGDTSTTYGSDAWRPYTYTLIGNANGDTVDSVKENGITAIYTNTGAVTDAASNEKKIYIKDADGKYQLLGDFTLTGQTAKNYEIETNTPGKATVDKATVKVKLNDVSTTYGTAFDTGAYGYDADTIEGLTNGDGSDVVTSALDGTYGKGDITYINTGDASAEEKQAGKVTKTVNGGPYYLEGSTDKTLKNYNIEIEKGNATINKAALHLTTGDYTEAYGDAAAVQSDLDTATAVTGNANGDDLEALVSQLGITNTTDALLSSDRTNDVKYKADGSLDRYTIGTAVANTSLDNYDVVVDRTGTVTLKPVPITITNEMVQTYGSSDKTFKEVTTPTLVNGDAISTVGLSMTPKAGGAYETNRDGRTTADAGTYKNDLESDGGGIVHEDGSDARKNYSVTIEGDIIVNKAPLEITTKDVRVDYGTDYGTTVGKTVSLVDGLTNGDAEKASDLSYDYGNYGGGYIENNTKTNHVGDYDFKTTVSNKSEDFLKNYTISGGDATLTINPKDVHFHVDGNGNTLGDVVYTVTDPNNPSSPDPINGQLVYGETVTPSYTPDGRLPNGHYGVSTSLPDYGPIDSGKVYGNYRYHYDGDITVNLPSKPDIVPPVNPPVTPGTGTVTPLPEMPENTPNTPENTTETTGDKTVWDGDRDRGGDRPEDKRVVTLPFFKVLEDKTTHRYGTYDVAKRTTEVKIAPSAQVLPEPNQPATQYRELDTELTTDKGTGEFTLKYNGSRFTILPDDDAAAQLIVVGDETKNRDFFEKALHVAFTKMGLEVADLDGVYIHFGKE